MQIMKGIRLRIYPNKDQCFHIWQNFGCRRFVWNQMLAMLETRHDNNADASFLSYKSLNYLLVSLKREHRWLRETESTSLQETTKDLDEAYRRFFRHTAKHPKFKSRKYLQQSYRIRNTNGNIRILTPHYLKLPKLGVMRFRNGQAISGKIKNVTIRHTKTDHYEAVLCVVCESQAGGKTGRAIGLDMGITSLVALSNGDKKAMPRFDKQFAEKKHYWERRYARRLRQAKTAIAWDRHEKVLNPRQLSDFKNVEKARVMLAKYDAKVHNQRNDFLHKLTTHLVRDNDTIVIENLKASNMMRNRHLSRAIANQAWRRLRMLLAYKCQWAGKTLIVVNPRNTSRICHNCGVDSGKKPLDVREWTCPQCGRHQDRDVNAAINILQRGLVQAVAK